MTCEDRSRSHVGVCLEVLIFVFYVELFRQKMWGVLYLPIAEMHTSLIQLILIKLQLLLFSQRIQIVKEVDIEHGSNLGIR